MLLDQSSNQLLKTHFLGRDNFVWWVGQIALRETSGWDKTDISKKEQGKELYYNRVKVRIFGYHTANCNDLPDDKLPWAHILVPPGEANGVGKIGKAHSYQGGETVIGFFLDGDDGQQPVIFGSLYKSSEIKSSSKDTILENSCSKFEPFDPNQAGKHNSLSPKDPGGKNVGTGQGDVNSKGTPAKGNAAGIENIGAEKGDSDTSAATKLFSSKLDNKTVQPSLCNKNRFANITAAIESLLKKIKNYQYQAGKFYNKVKNKASDITSEIRKVSSVISGEISTLIKQAMNWLFEKISKALGLTFGGLFPKTKQSELGKKIDKILEAIYAAFKKLGLSLPDIVGDALSNFVGNAIAPKLCAIQNFLGQLLGKILNTLENTILPLLDQINSLIQGALGSVANLLSSSLNLIGVINQLLNYADNSKFCPLPQAFSITQGISFSIVGDIKGMVNKVGNVGSLVGNAGDQIKSFGNLKLDLNSCNPKKNKCGPPEIIISGGGGSNASAKAVVNKKGKLVGAIITNSGSGYVEAPKVSILDSCEIGFGGKAIAIIGSANTSPSVGIGTTIPTVGAGTTDNTVVAIVITDPGDDYLSVDIEEEYEVTPGIGTTTIGIGNTQTLLDSDGNSYTGIVTSVTVINPGYGYDENTVVTVGKCKTKVEIGAAGGISAVTVEDGCLADEIPTVTINSENGAAAKLVPVLSFTQIGIAQTVGITSVISVIDCVQK